jgi:hypothetical protein
MAEEGANPGQAREMAEADGPAPAMAMLEAMIRRADAARSRYLAKLAEPGLTVHRRHRVQHLLAVLEMRLSHLRAEQLALAEGGRQQPRLEVEPQPQRKRVRASYRGYLPRPD